MSDWSNPMRLTIKLQLALAFGFVIVLLLVGNLFGLNGLGRLG